MGTDEATDVSAVVEGVRKWWVQIMALVGLIAWLAVLDSRLSRLEAAVPAISAELKDLNESVTRLVTLEEERQRVKEQNGK